MKKVTAAPELRAQLEKVGARPVGNSPAEFAAQVRKEVERMKRLVKERQIKLDE
jgi:tripartite-type tricarboxylate transporter receptor subunit TctC